MSIRIEQAGQPNPVGGLFSRTIRGLTDIARTELEVDGAFIQEELAPVIQGINVRITRLAISAFQGQARYGSIGETVLQTATGAVTDAVRGVVTTSGVLVTTSGVEWLDTSGLRIPPDGWIEVAPT